MINPIEESLEIKNTIALINGQPVTELPKDLYIPPDALAVILEAFEGPLDLLLYLIKKQNINILDIPIAEITRQYMEYIEVMRVFALELAGEYLVMAALLAEIKSRMLLPRPPSENPEEEGDPRAELIRRLQEYERFKKAAEEIDLLPRVDRDFYLANAQAPEIISNKPLPKLELQALLLAFKDVYERAKLNAHHKVSRQTLSIRERMSDVLEKIQSREFVAFNQLFKVEEGKMGVVVTFIAILELMRQSLLEIIQTEPFGPIHVKVKATE